jgi:thiol-disulfide isomerase/thioredoxin
VPDTRYSSLGRGVWWLLTDIEAFGRITDRFGWYAALWTRWPTGDASNGFHWGSEQRLSLATSVARLGLDRLTGSLGVEWQRRDRASEVLLGERKPFLNGGGDWVDLVPTLRSDIGGGFSAVLSSRIPLSRNVVGLQGVQNTAYFMGIQFSMGTSPSTAAEPSPPLIQVGAPPATPEIGKLVRPGVVTLVDYTATWCAPCQKLGAELDLWLAAQPGVVVQRVDATNWLQPEMDRFLPGCTGLPVLDVYGRDGRLAARLVGPDAFAYAAPVSEALAVAVPAAASATSAFE